MKAAARPIDAPAAGPPAESQGIQALQVGLDVLEAVIRSGRERGASELAKELGLTKFQAFRHLHTLCHAGFLTQSPDSGRFAVGRRAYALVGAISESDALVRSARAEMARLRDARGHTVTLARLVDGPKVMIVDVESGRATVQYVLKIGVMFDLHASAHGKVALAFGPEGLLQQVLGSGLGRQTEFTVTDPIRLRRELDTVRARGWASAAQETVRGMNTIAAPLMSRRGYEGSIGLFAPIELLPPEPHPADLDALLTSARHISREH